MVIFLYYLYIICMDTTQQLFNTNSNNSVFKEVVVYCQNFTCLVHTSNFFVNYMILPSTSKWP